MGRKHKVKTPRAWLQGMKIFKGALKASTHVFTVAGVTVAATPLIDPVINLAHGQVQTAADHIRSNTIGTGTNVSDAIKAGLVNVGIPLVLGIGLVWGGAQLRKRIGN